MSDRTYFSNDINLGLDSAGIPKVLPKERRGRHTICLGATGVGKSKWLESIIRQDLLAYHRTQCGLAVLDPHGTLFSNLLAFAAANGLDHLPVVPFDCRRLDWLVSFNPLRARSNIESNTIISGCMESLLLVWGQFTTDPTPRLEKWLRAMLHMIFFSNGTLGDSLAILRNPDLRKSLVRAVEDDVTRTVWQIAECLKESEFQTVTESLCNRVVRFVSNTLLRLTLNQVGPSLDFGTIIQKGGVLLVSLATAGGVIDEIDARTIGALLLQDLWTAAKVRGKGEAGQQKSFRIFVDEFGRFLNLSMAEGMAEARGFGLEFFLCTQSTTKLRATPVGQQVLDAVLANAHTKIIFNVQHPQDVDLLTPWIFRNEIDPNQVKYQGYSTKVVGYKIKYFDSTNESTTRGSTDSTNWSETISESETFGTSSTHSETTGISHSRQRSRSLGASTGLSRGSDHSHAESAAESAAEGTTVSRAEGHTEQSSTNESENRHLDGDNPDIMEIVDKEPIDVNKVFVDEYEEHQALNRAIDKTNSTSRGQSDSASTSLATTRSVSNARAIQNTEAESESTSRSVSQSDSVGETDTVSSQSSDSNTTSENFTNGKANMTGGGRSASRSASHGKSRSPMLVPILEKEASTPVYRSVDEQMFIFSQFLTSEPDRHAVVRIGIDPPVQITTPTIAPARISAKGAEAWATWKLKQLSFALPFAEATRRLEERQKLFSEKYLGSSSTDEPTQIVRRIRKV